MTQLHCNWLSCRRALERGSAVVTTCYHIFCIECANELFAQRLVCPACHQDLGNEGDIVITSLDPDESYRMTVLAGLPPSVIMDIAANAMSFWTYQTSQESAYQALVVKNKDAKLAALDEQLRITQRQLEAMNLQGSSDGRREVNVHRNKLPHIQSIRKPTGPPLRQGTPAYRPVPPAPPAPPTRYKPARGTPMNSFSNWACKSGDKKF